MNRRQRSLIESLVAALVHQYQAQKIILFGSYASGKADEDKEIIANGKVLYDGVGSSAGLAIAGKERLEPGASKTERK